MEVLYESSRGCGFRKPGGLYLVARGIAEPCGKLPLRLDICPTCGTGIHPSRGWTWVSPGPLFRDRPCVGAMDEEQACSGCPLADTGREHLPIGPRAGLLWIGAKFYTPESWLEEAGRMGVSRRIPAVPRDFELGMTWVLVAHRTAIKEPCPSCLPPGQVPDPDPDCDACEGKSYIPHPAIFHAFRPDAVQYVVKGDETDDEIEGLLKRGIEPVRVVPVGRQPALLQESHA